MIDSSALLPLPDALSIVDSVLADIRVPIETVRLADATGRVLAADQVSRVDMPPFDKSAMDGYAIGDSEALPTYRVVETIAAGSVPRGPLGAGEAAKVMTGAPVPPGTAKVVMVEDTTESAGVVSIHANRSARHIALMGEDVRCGDVVGRESSQLGVEEIATLIACGVTEVQVYHRTRVAIVSTGDEIVDHPDLLTPGKIMDSNAPLLVGLCRRHHLDVTAVLKAPDDRDATTRILTEATGSADIVLVSGGVSVGDFDFVTDAMGDIGLKVHFTRIAVKPGKPTTFASGGPGVVFGLPGNPVSVHLMFHLFALRAARQLMGMSPDTRQIALVLKSDYRRKKADRAQYVPGRILPDGFVAPVGFHGSGHLAALTETDGFFVVPVGVTELAAGERVAFIQVRLRGAT